MPWSGSAPSQTFTRTDGTRTGDDTWTQAAAAPVNIEADDHDTHDTDVGDGLNACLKKDGGNTATADIPMGGFTFTNIAAAGARTEPARFSDVQDNLGQYVATVGGTADVITLTPTIPITAYAAGQRFSFIASGDNTTNVTVSVSGVGAKAIARNDGSATALAAGEMQGGALVDIEYDGTRFLLLSIVGALLAANNLSDVTAATARTNLGLGTGDSPEFTAVNIGHATQNTLTGSGGNLSVEGNLLYRAGGTDVPVTDGGTGASTAADARTNLGVISARAYSEYTDSASLSGSIPLDNTIPQSGEGDQILTAAITLKRADSRVRVRFSGWVSRDAEDTNFIAALFSDLSANALNVYSTGNSNDTGTTRTQPVHLEVEHAPATVGPITYQARAGVTGGNYSFNGFPTATAVFGGASRATLVVEEVFIT